MNDLFLKIINMSISASWLVLAVLLLRFVLKKAPKWVNVLLWGIVAVRLAFPFSIESALSLIPSAETVPMDIEMAVQPTINSGVPVINKVSFTEETLVSGGIKTPYYRLVFADAKTQWTYRIDAVLGNVLEKQQKEIVTTDFISLEEAKQIALKDAGLDDATQKIVFTREELSRNSGKPCYILEFYTAKKQYSYKVDAKDGSIMEAYHFILLADAKKIALDDAGVSEKVTFTEETLVAGGIKSPYYYFAFESASARWTYKIDAVLGVIMDKTCDKIIPSAPEFIGLEKAKQIALDDAGLDETAQKIVFTREELSRNSGKPCYILEFYTDKCAYSYKVDAVSGDIIGKKTDWFSRQESETVPETSQNSDSKQRTDD